MTKPARPRTGRPRAIPPRLEAEVISRHADGLSCRQIADWLRTEHQVDASYGAVARLLKTHREELAAETRQVARTKLAPSIESDIDGFDELLERLREAEDECRKAPRMMKERLKALELQARIYDRKLHYAGAAEPETTAVTAGVIVLPAEIED